MKKIQKETTIYKDIYVSVDGKEFNNEADCRAWENSYKGTIVASWKLIEKVEANPCSLGMPYANDDHECYVIKPKNLEEITLINAYIESSVCCGNGVKLTTNHIGKLVAMDFGYDHDYCDVYILENHINSIVNYVAELENKMNEKEGK